MLGFGAIAEYPIAGELPSTSAASDTVVLVSVATGSVAGLPPSARLPTVFQFTAPYPALQTTTLLPSPQFSDSEAVLASVIRKLAMDGTRYTYVKRRNGRQKLKWTFWLSRNKGLELRALIRAYFTSPVQAIDHNARVWVGNFTSNPFEFDTTEGAQPAIAPMPRGELQAIDIEFEGVEQYA